MTAIRKGKPSKVRAALYVEFTPSSGPRWGEGGSGSRGTHERSSFSIGIDHRAIGMFFGNRGWRSVERRSHDGSRKLALAPRYSTIPIVRISVWETQSW